MTRLPTSARSSLRLCALSAALLLTVAGPATAGEVKKTLPRGANDGPSTKAAPIAVAPNARLAAFVRPGPTIVRQKGVQSVTNPEVGVYCVKPTVSSGVSPGNSIVIVSPEFRFSAINEVKVQWMATHHGCGSDRFGIITLADFNLDGFYGFSDDVAFSIVVP